MRLTAFFLLFFCTSSLADVRTIHSLKMGGDSAVLDATHYILAGAPPEAAMERAKTECKWERTHPGDNRDLIDPKCVVATAFGSQELAQIAFDFFKLTGYAISVGQDADLGESDFDPARPIPWTKDQMQVVVQAIADLPAHFKKLKWMRCFFLSRSLPAGMSVAYIQDKNSGTPAAIALSADFADPTYSRAPKEVVAHEMGHIWTYHFGRKGWQELSTWEPQGLGLRGVGSNFVSEYSRQSPVEDFAESFAFYRYHPSLLKKADPKKYRYMLENVFKKHEFKD